MAEKMKGKHVIPDDVLLDILVYLPPKSLLRFKSVSKAWYSSVASPDFIKRHHVCAKHQKLALISLSYFQLINSPDRHNEEEVVETRRVDFPSLKDERIWNVLGSCNGLMCVVVRDSRIVLWNPSIRKYRHVPLPRMGNNLLSPFLGFGYDNTRDDYKIVIFGHKENLMGPYVFWSYDKATVEIYSLKTNSWKQMPHLNWHVRLSIPGNASGTLAKNCSVQSESHSWAVFWVVEVEVEPQEEMGELKLLCLDLVKEKFSLYDLPDDMLNIKMYCNHDPLFHQLRVLGGRLSMILYRSGGDVDIWSLKKKKKQGTWIKLITIPQTRYLSYDKFAPKFIMKNGQVLLKVMGCGVAIGSRLCLFNPEDKAVTGYEKQSLIAFDDVIAYTETLVSPNPVIACDDVIAYTETSVSPNPVIGRN